MGAAGARRQKGALLLSEGVPPRSWYGRAQVERRDEESIQV